MGKVLIGDRCMNNFNYQTLQSLALYNKHYRDMLNDKINSLEFLGIFSPLGDKYMIDFSRIKDLMDTCEKLYKSISVKDLKYYKYAEESYYSCIIEGAKTTLPRTKIITSNDKFITKDKSELMVKNTFETIKYLNSVRKIDNDNIRKIWEKLINGVCENVDIKGTKYRIGNVVVGGFSPCEPEYVEYGMNEMFRFKHKNKFIESIVKHFVFIYCHPFCDGNGRMARLIERDNLIKNGFDCFRFITTSKIIAENIYGYYNSIVESENMYLDITPFIEFNLNSYIIAYNETFK